MRRNDRAFRPTGPQVPAPVWVWVLVMVLLAIMGVVAALTIVLA